MKKAPAPTPATNPPTSNKRITINLPDDYLEFYPVLGPAIYLYLWCIYRTTKEYTADASGQRVGLVYRGIPVKDGKVAEELNTTIKNIQRWRKKLEDCALIRTQQAGRGTMYAVLDSYKFNAKDVKSGPPDWTKMSTLKK